MNILLIYKGTTLHHCPGPRCGGAAGREVHRGQEDVPPGADLRLPRPRRGRGQLRDGRGGGDSAAAAHPPAQPGEPGQRGARGLQEGRVHRVLQQRGHDSGVPTPRGPVRQVKTRAGNEPSRSLKQALQSKCFSFLQRKLYNPVLEKAPFCRCLLRDCTT